MTGQSTMSAWNANQTQVYFQDRSVMFSDDKVVNLAETAVGSTVDRI